MYIRKEVFYLNENFSYVYRSLYLKLLVWTTIYVFSSMDENERIVLSTLILWWSLKFIINNFKNIKNSLVNMQEVQLVVDGKIKLQLQPCN